MKKLYICEYPYILYKTLIERMGDDQNSYSLILSNAASDLGPMVPVLRRSGLFDRVEFFPSEPYKDYYKLIFCKFPTSKIRRTLLHFKNAGLRILRQKNFKNVDFPFPVDFNQYDKIVCTELSSVINGYLSMNHIEHAISEHAKGAFQAEWKPFDLLYCVLNVLDKLHVINGLSSTSRFCKEIIVNEIKNLAKCVRHKKVTAWDVDEHISNLDAERKEQIFKLYADAYGLNIDLRKKYDLLLTAPLYFDAYLPSEAKQVEFCKDVIHNKLDNPVLIKVHPRDSMDYQRYFPECIVVNRNISSEVLAFSQHLKLSTVFTVGSSSAGAFESKAEKVIVLEPEGFTSHRLKSLEAYW